MSNREFRRLMKFHQAKIKAPYTRTVSRRTAKSQANGTGQILKTSKIVSEVPLEKYFAPRPR